MDRLLNRLDHLGQAKQLGQKHLYLYHDHLDLERIPVDKLEGTLGKTYNLLEGMISKMVVGKLHQ
jgi:hypothetical protein